MCVLERYTATEADLLFMCLSPSRWARLEGSNGNAGQPQVICGYCCELSAHAQKLYHVAMERKDTFERAKKLLLGAVDTVLEIATGTNEKGTERSLTVGTAGPSTTSFSSAVSEHKRIFGYKPSKAFNSHKAKGKGPRPSTSKATISSWRRECICLSECDQNCKPTPEDKVKLAKLGLGLKTLSFRSEGDADHVHDVIVGAFPVLKDCGGYTLLRLGSGSRSLMEIEGSESGVTVSYLKDILNQAKLYIRPLQCDITVEDMQPYLEHSVSEYKSFLNVF